jgi:MFS family permease
MPARWLMLFVLFAARTTMAIQFQVVGALSPLFRETFGVGLADIGFLIGIYFVPAIVLAFPGGALARRFGDKRMVLVGLGMMILGAFLMALFDDWNAQIAGRILAGIGSFFLNVLMTKMVADWFVGREISVALALYLGSFPVGIALGLVILPFVAASDGLFAALNLIVILTVAGFLIMAFGYRSQPDVAPATVATRQPLVGATLWAVIIAGAIWGLYNLALSVIFSFGPEMFVARGWPITKAGSIVSTVLWLLAIGGPIGGLIADWSGRRMQTLILANLSFAAAIVFAAFSENVMLAVVLLGLTSGLGIGVMVSLPTAVLAPAQRATGMSVFFAMNAAGSLCGPVVSGWLAELTGDVSAAFQFGAISLVVSLLLLIPYQRLAARRSTTA